VMNLSANVRNSSPAAAPNAELVFQLVDARTGHVLVTSPIQHFSVAPNGAYRALWRVDARATGQQVNVVVLIGPQNYTRPSGSRISISARIPALREERPARR
jgi:hypothetical protein